MQPFIRTIPRPRFVHREKDFIGLLVVRKEINHRWISNSGRHDFLLVLVLVIVIVIVIANCH